MIRQILMLLTLVGMAVLAHAGAEYVWWFDGSTEPFATAPLEGSGSWSLDLDVSSLDGSRPHTLHFQVVDGAGHRSSPRSAMFTKAFTLQGSMAHIYVDGNYHSSVPTDGSSGHEATYEIDASQYGYGLHTVMMQVVAPGNIPAVPVEGIFMRVPTDSEIGSYRCFYTIDNDKDMIRAGAYSDGVVHADIDVATLTTGLHSIQFMLATEDGLTTQCYSSYFMKLPLGGGDISSYSYWVNDDTENIATVQLEKAVAPFRLTALLPLRSYPLRTSSFRFRIESGTPVIYPLNDFNLMVSSASGQFTVTSTQYYDSNHHAAVSPQKISTTTDGSVIKIPAIETGEIKWYEFDVKHGDSISVAVSNPCMVDMFGADGTPLYSASGYDAVSGGGFHAFEDGKIYMALHDAKKTVPIDITLKRIDRYALLKWTPQAMAADGFVFLDLIGNGFDNLKRVSLGNERTIECDSISVYDYSYARVCFNFYNKRFDAQGKQSINLYFEDETEGLSSLTIPNAIEIEESKSEVIITRVQNYPIPGPRRAVSICIENPGSTAKWGVPVNIAVEGNKKIEFDNFHIIAPNPVNGVEFPVVSITDNILDTGKRGTFMPMIFPYIGPHETIRLNVWITSDVLARYNMYAWAGESWSEAGRYLLGESGGIITPPAQVSCLNYDTFSDMQSIIGEYGGESGAVANTYLGIGQAIGGIYLGLGKRQRAEERRCNGADYDNIAEYLPQYNAPVGMSPQAIFQNSMPLPEWLSLPLSHLYATNQRQEQHAECSNPMPDPQRVAILLSQDPNDILGYTSPAQTEHIGVGVKSLNYTIEFENDPEKATASATSILVTNQLDASVFDLTTFKAREFRIGSHMVDFEGASNGIKTIDMRPAINAIAQVEVAYDEAAGELRLMVTSLDPISLEPTIDVMQGVLPVNNDGEGVGELCYDIDLLDGLSDGSVVDNMATIIFDENEPLNTPVWHNVTDYVLPESTIENVATEDNITFSIRVNGIDSGSGIWHYDLYARWDGQSDWTQVASSLETEDGCLQFIADVPMLSAQFCTVAYDKAGNREDTAMMRRLLGDVDGSGAVDANDVLILRGYYIGRPVTLDLTVADVNADGSVDAQDATAARVIYLASELMTRRARHVRTRLIISKTN